MQTILLQHIVYVIEIIASIFFLLYRSTRPLLTSLISVTKKFSRRRLEREDFSRSLYSIVYSFFKDYFVVSLWYRLVLTIGNLRNSIAHKWEDLGSKSYVHFTPLNLWESKKGNGAAYLSARVVTCLKGSSLSKFRFKPASHCYGKHCR